MLVGGVVVEHDMQLTARVGAGHQLEEVQELAVTMAGMAGVSHLPGGHRQRGKQGRGSVPDLEATSTDNPDLQLGESGHHARLDSSPQPAS